MKISRSDLRKLIKAIKNKNLSVEQVIELIGKSDVQSEKVIDTANKIKLAIDYTKTVEQAISDGRYDWKDRDIVSRNFPISPEMVGKKVEVQTKLFHFNRVISEEDAISKMDKAGYRPAMLMELLTLGILFPELQSQFPIVALGSLWRDAVRDCHVPCLNVDGRGGRGPGLRLFANYWPAHYRFLGVRK